MTIRLLDKNLFELSFKSHIFNAGEPHLCLDDETISWIIKDKGCIIDAKIQNSSDILYLYCLVDAIKRSIVENIEISLHCDYFPGSRQDRICNKGEPLTVKIYADLINNLNFSSVEICDPHSDVTPSLINNCRLYPIENIIYKVINDCKPDFIISPDAGASKRIYNYLSKIKCTLPVIQCLKQRDTKTGKLSGFEICRNQHFINKKLLILDDICENGGTFIGLASLPKFQLADSLYLYVTHGIFPNGQETIDNLHKYFSKIYCTNSFENNIVESDRFKIIKL